MSSNERRSFTESDIDNDDSDDDDDDHGDIFDSFEVGVVTDEEDEFNFSLKHLDPRIGQVLSSESYYPSL